MRKCGRHGQKPHPRDCEDTTIPELGPESRRLHPEGRDEEEAETVGPEKQRVHRQDEIMSMLENQERELIS